MKSEYSDNIIRKLESELSSKHPYLDEEEVRWMRRNVKITPNAIERFDDGFTNTEIWNGILVNNNVHPLPSAAIGYIFARLEALNKEFLENVQTKAKAACDRYKRIWLSAMSMTLCPWHAFAATSSDKFKKAAEFCRIERIDCQDN